MLSFIDWSSVGYWALRILAVIGSLAAILAIAVAISVSKDERRDKKKEKEQEDFDKLYNCMLQRLQNDFAKGIHKTIAELVAMQKRNVDEELIEKIQSFIDKKLHRLDKFQTDKACMLKKLFMMVSLNPAAAKKLANYWRDKTPEEFDKFVEEMVADLPSNDKPHGSKSTKDSKKEEGKKRKS